jgi:hypothetical protein
VSSSRHLRFLNKPRNEADGRVCIPDAAIRLPCYLSDSQQDRHWESLYPFWDPDDPPKDALDRSFVRLALAAYSLVDWSYSEAIRDNPSGDSGEDPGPLP